MEALASGLIDNRRMGIGKYIKEIGRGKAGARDLTREQATDMFGQILDGNVTDLEIGAFCLAMRIKGESAVEMAGFLDAIYARMARIPTLGSDRPTVVIPSYNGARKLPVLTPLLALLVAREGHPVVVHGTATESHRVFTSDVFAALDLPIAKTLHVVQPGSLAFFPTALFHIRLQALLDARRVVGLRNSAHSLVKLMNPCDGPCLLVTSYTHPEYAISMAQTLTMMRSNALLLRGTEGEAVADPRRAPGMQAFVHGFAQSAVAHQSGTLTALPDVPATTDAARTASYIQAVLRGDVPVPTPIQAQVAQILHTVMEICEPTTP